MATLGTYFYDGTSFALATGLYTDAGFTTVAPDGFYSQGAVVRQMSGGVLGTAQTCASCINSCGSSVISNNVFGQHNVAVDVGTGTGAVIVEFTVGIDATARCTWTYNGITASEYSSPLATGGYLQGLIGSESCCGVTNAVGSAGSNYTGSVLNYSGGAWTPSGATATWGPFTNQAAGGVDLDPVGVGWGTTVMVVPKTVAATTINFVIENSGGSAANAYDWSMVVKCPAQLPSFTGTLAAQIDCPAACLIATSPDTFYHAEVSGTAGTPAVNDWVFSDPEGANAIADGYYSVFFGGAFYCMETANGVIINLTAC